MSFKLWEPAVPYSESCLASKTYILTSGNRPFLAMVTSGSQPGNHKFQGPGTGSSLPWWPLVPTLEPSVPTLRNWKFFAMVAYGSQVGKHEFEPVGTGSSLQW